MTRLTLRCSVIVLAFSIPALLTSSASADTIVQWTLSGVTFTDGVTASGSFLYDATTNTYSAVNLITTPLPNFPTGETYMTLLLGGKGGGSFVPNLADLTGSLQLDLIYTQPLTDAGGTIDLNLGLSFIILCASGCDPNHSPIQTQATAGQLIGTPIPEPCSLLLLGTGLLGMVGTARRKWLGPR